MEFIYPKKLRVNEFFCDKILHNHNVYFLVVSFYNKHINQRWRNTRIQKVKNFIDFGKLF